MKIIATDLKLLNNVGNDYLLGGITGANFAPQYVLFYRLKVLCKNQPDVTKWGYQFLVAGSWDGTNIAQFVEMVLSDDLPPLSPTSDNPLTAPNVTVTDPCYIALQLTSDDDVTPLRYQDGVAAIKTADDHQAQYRRLSHVDAAGNVHVGTSTTNCNLVYFAVKTVDAQDEDDPFNIYVQRGADATQLRVIDPAIKNRGGDDLSAKIAQKTQSASKPT